MTALDPVIPGRETGATLRRPAMLFAGLVAALLSALWQPVFGMMRIWWESATYQHGFLVAPAVLWLIWQRRAEFAALAGPGSVLALLPLGGALALALLGQIAGVNLFAHAGLALALMALVPLCFGWRVTRRFWFPVLFLGFMVPAGDVLIAPLQELTADVSVWLLEITGIPVYREGLLIELPTGLWEVAEACAGLRFLIANLFVAALFAYFSYTKLWKWVVFGVIAIALPVAANCLRAYGIMLLAHLTDNALAVGIDHLVYGWVFFSAVMLAMLWIGGRFADRGIGDPWPEPQEEAQIAPGSILPQICAALLIVAVPVTAFATAAQPSPLPQHLAQRLSPAGWKVLAHDPDAPDRWEPRFESADRFEQRSLSDGTHRVDLSVAAYTHQRDGAEALHWANRFDDDTIWKRAGLGAIRLDTGATGLPTDARRTALTHSVQDAQRGTLFKARMVVSWVIVGDEATSGGRRAKLAELRHRLLGVPSPAAVIALSAEYPGTGREAEAIDAIETALAGMPPISGALTELP